MHESVRAASAPATAYVCLCVPLKQLSGLPTCLLSGVLIGLLACLACELACVVCNRLRCQSWVCVLCCISQEEVYQPVLLEWVNTCQ